jgi:hypothetical protein
LLNNSKLLHCVRKNNEIMIKNVKYILTGVFFYSCQIYAQTLGVVKGVVKDKSNNETLPGAVVVLDKTKGISADVDGIFYISTSEGSHTLDCELVGYKKYSETINVKGNDTITVNIVLGNGNQLLR